MGSSKVSRLKRNQRSAVRVSWSHEGVVVYACTIPLVFDYEVSSLSRLLRDDTHCISRSYKCVKVHRDGVWEGGLVRMISQFVHEAWERCK